MQTNPVLVESLRGNWVENVHRGAIAVCDAEGKVILAVGDIDRPIFPRSAIKAMQALAIFEAGADVRFKMSDAELALACASHHGEPAHVDGVASFLTRLGLTLEALECGAHWPTNAQAREALRAAGERPTPLHNNCSGKHAGMLAVACALGIDHAGYVERDHAVQRLVRASVEAMIGESLTIDRCGTDGCSIPTFAAPLKAFARGFARMATGGSLERDQANAAQRLFDAAAGHAHLVAGTDHPDTRLMAAFDGRLMQKVGAEGVQCGAIRDRGWGYAIKCDDGNIIASQVMLSAILLALSEPPLQARFVLEDIVRQTIKSVRGTQVGEVRAVEGLFDAFAGRPA